jgi:hypothetical protein
LAATQFRHARDKGLQIDRHHELDISCTPLQERLSLPTKARGGFGGLSSAEHQQFTHPRATIARLSRFVHGSPHVAAAARRNEAFQTIVILL